MLPIILLIVAGLSPLFFSRRRQAGRETDRTGNAEAALRKALGEMEDKVGNLRADLDEANQRLWVEMESRRAAEESLLDSEARYRSLLDNSLNGFALHQVTKDAEGNPVDYIFLQVNGAFEEITGLSVKQVIGKRVTEVIPRIKETPLIGIYAEVALTGKAARFEMHFPPSDRTYEIVAYSIRRGQFAAVFSDITDRQPQKGNDVDLRPSMRAGTLKTLKSTALPQEGGDVE